jgi:hypothetical protein
MEANPLSIDTIAKLAKKIENLKEGLNPEVIYEWFVIVEEEAKAKAPAELRDLIRVKQDPILPMKFKIDISRRAVKYFIDAIENNLEKMPLATRLYFQKVEEVILSEYEKY